jgi:hypothetical protein
MALTWAARARQPSSSEKTWVKVVAVEVVGERWRRE